MAEEKTPAQKAHEMLGNAIGMIAAQTGMVTEFTTQVVYREPSTDEEKKRVEDAQAAYAEAVKKQAEKEAE